MEQNTFLLYGANGYTGELIARHAHLYGLVPILAGRNEKSLRSMAEKLKLSFRVFDLENTTALHEALKEVKAVIHAAGPFHFTAKQMVEACLQTNTHYLDINGDISVFEMLRNFDAAATKAGIMLLPGAGFDVVPTDCTALRLKKLLPDANSLKLAFASQGGGLSHGTAITMVNKLGKPGAIRKNGKIVPDRLGKKGIWVDFFTGRNTPSKKIFVMSIPWGDVATAYYTTGIPNVTAYTAIPRKTYRLLKLQFLFNWSLRTPFARNIIRKKINKRPAGPNDDQRSKAMSMVWGEAENAGGEKVEAGLCGPDGYTLTMYSTLLVTKKILEGNFKPGYQTPASAYGEEFVLEIPGVERDDSLAASQPAVISL